MTEVIEELKGISSSLTEYVEVFEASEVNKALERLQQSAQEIGKASSRSWLGYHANVYHASLQTPPARSHFNSDWGFNAPFGTRDGSWHEFKADEIRSEIMRRALNPDLPAARTLATKGDDLFTRSKDDIIIVLQALISSGANRYFEKLLDEAGKIEVLNAANYIDNVRPKGQLATRDEQAVSQGIWIPPHFAVLAECFDLRGPVSACRNLATVARKSYSFLERTMRAQREKGVGTNVFIGHGRSEAWRELKDFIQDRLGLPWDEFNRVPVAGTTNIARLTEMLEAAAIAFLVLTAEDEQPDGKTRARVNVIHEAGLFQGKLGFSKAIILLEDGCEEFSNIEGLGQIRFPEGKIAACFEEVRRVLEREGLIAED
jgi:hypothetical protein